MLSTARGSILYTTAVSPAMKKLVKTVLELEKGEVWLFGLDKDLEDEAFEIIDETHSQYELKQLLDYLEIKRCCVENIVESLNKSREKLISEVWGYDFYGDVRTLDTHIKLLRKSLGRYANLIVTLRGVGYRFEG